jgi:hypothetical protein
MRWAETSFPGAQINMEKGMKRLLAKLLVVVSALLLAPVAATAAHMEKIVNIGFGDGPIRVISENGTSWTKIVESNLTLPVQIDLGIDSGGVKSWQIKQGGTNIAQSADYEYFPAHVQETYVVTGSTEHFGGIEYQLVLGACNDFLSVGEGIHEKHTIWHGVQLELHGLYVMTNGGEYPDYSGYGTVPVMVECMPYLPASGGVTVSEGDHPNRTPLTIKEAKLFLTTYSNGQNTGNTLEACPMLKTTVRFETSKPRELQSQPLSRRHDKPHGQRRVRRQLG